MKKNLKKYAVFVKYVISAGLSFAIDLILFTIFTSMFKIFTTSNISILYATVSARLISSFINYSLNRNRVFKNNDDSSKIDKTSFIKYVCLVIIQMFVSSFTVMTIYDATKWNETLIKIPVECFLFLVNFFIQKIFIFPNKQLKITLTPKIKTCIQFVLSICTAFAFTAKLDSQKIVQWSRRDTDSLFLGILTVVALIFYKKFLNKHENRKPFKILSIILTLLLIFGYSFDTTDSTYFVYGKAIFILISLVKFIGFYPFIYTILNIIFDKLQSLKIKNDKNRKFIQYLEQNPFKFTVFALIICYLPYIISFYPAILSPDPVNQIKEFMGIHNRYMDSVVLLDQSVTITNFNPVIHTLLLGSCFNIGNKIGNVNLGLFLYSILQISIVIFTLAYTIKFLKKEKVSNKILLIIIAIFAFVPIFPLYSLSTNKDTIFTMLFLLYTIKIYEIIKYDYDIKKILTTILIGTLLFLFRNNGIYTILLSLPFCLFIQKKRKKVFFTILILLTLYTGYNKILLPYFKITPTSIREMLSIPFQQTAALIQNDENVIEEKDKAIIAKILDYEEIKENYDPELADKVKNTYNKFATNEDLNAYFNVWFKYLLKKPLTYIDATINNMYGYFYPNTVRWYVYTGYNERLKEAGFDYHFNKLSLMRKILEGYSDAFQYIPVLGLLVNIGFNVWIYMYLFVSLIINKNKQMLILLTPAISLVLVCIASPANAYFRYALPFITTLPVIFSLLLLEKPKKS